MEYVKVKEEHTKDDVRRIIIGKALELFTSRGIKEVKMDDIASLLSVSKRTIYELFGDKEQLLFESLMLQQEMMREEAKEIINMIDEKLEKENLRSLTLEASALTGVPMAGVGHI